MIPGIELNLVRGQAHLIQANGGALRDLAGDAANVRHTASSQARPTTLGHLEGRGQCKGSKYTQESCKVRQSSGLKREGEEILIKESGNDITSQVHSTLHFTKHCFSCWSFTVPQESSQDRDCYPLCTRDGADLQNLGQGYDRNKTPFPGEVGVRVGAGTGPDRYTRKDS